jgi:hypothetical protein
MATNSALLTSHILANRCESSAPGGIRTPNPQIRSRSEAAIQQHPSRTKAKKDRWFGIVDRSPMLVSDGPIWPLLAARWLHAAKR